MNWKDSTSYSRGQEKPTSWTTDIGDLRITVTNKHIHYPGLWVMHCFEIGMDTIPFEAENVADAQKRAVELVRKKVEAWHKLLNDPLIHLYSE